MRRWLIALSTLSVLVLTQGVASEVYRLYLDGRYDEARSRLEASLSERPDFATALELGDLFCDKLADYARAESVYRSLIERYPRSPELEEVYYRLGLACELDERWVDAAKAYETVVIRYPKSRHFEDASTAIERCFKKNYQDRVARVDGYPITRLEFDEILSRMPDARRAHYSSDEGQRELVNELIDQRLLWVETRARRFDTIPRVAEQLRAIRTQILLQELYQRKILDQIELSEADLKRYYRTNLNEFMIPEQVRAREIRVDSQALADSLLRLLEGGAPFDSLAREFSTAPTKVQGGDLGLVPKGRYPELDSVIFALNPGELSGVVELADGFAIVKVEERVPQKPREFEQVRAQIETRLRRQKVDELYARYTGGLKAQAKIERFPAGDTMALVNHHPITRQEFQARVELLPPFIRRGIETPEGEAQFLDQLILERLLSEEAEAEDLWLANRVQERLQEEQRAILLRELDRVAVIEPARVDSNAVIEYYKANQEEFRVPERVRVRELKVDSLKEAEGLHRLLTRRPGILGWLGLSRPRVNFDSLARARSVAPSRTRGGDLGLFARHERSEPIAEAAFKLKPGQISPIITLEDGFVILKCEERVPPRIKELPQVFHQIEVRLRSERQRERREKLLSELRGRHLIEVYLDLEG